MSCFTVSKNASPRNASFLSGALLVIGSLISTGCAASGTASVAPPPPMSSLSVSEIQPVPDPSVAPFSSICQFVVDRRWVLLPRPNKISTGFLISSDHLLTAGHNFYSPRTNRVIARKTRCGLHQAQSVWEPEDDFHRSQLRVARKYRWDFAHDYALSRVGSHAPFAAAFRLPRGDEAALRLDDTTTIHVAGYAAERENDPHNGKVLYYATGRILHSDDPRRIYYGIETEGGMSGGPVWIERGGEYIVIGIHVGGAVVDGRSRGFARRLDADALTEIQSWLGAAGAPGPVNATGR